MAAMANTGPLRGLEPAQQGGCKLPRCLNATIQTTHPVTLDETSACSYSRAILLYLVAMYACSTAGSVAEESPAVYWLLLHVCALRHVRSNILTFLTQSELKLPAQALPVTSSNTRIKPRRLPLSHSSSKKTGYEIAVVCASKCAS